MELSPTSSLKEKETAARRPSRNWRQPVKPRSEIVSLEIAMNVSHFKNREDGQARPGVRVGQ